MPHIKVKKAKPSPEPRIGVVSSEDLTPKSLRARDYLYDATAEAKALVDEWVRDNPILHRRAEAVRLLEGRISAALRDAQAAGNREGRAQFARMM